jgi:hypothetical protein
VVRPDYDVVQPFEEGLAGVKIGEVWGFIDSSGKVVIPPRFADGSHFSEGLAAVREANGLYGYIDASGRYLIRPAYSVAGDFVDGLAPASADGTKFGYIDKSGAWAVKPAYYDAEHFSEGFALIHFPGGQGVERQAFGHKCRYGSVISSRFKGGGKDSMVPLSYQGGGFVEATKKAFIDKQGKPIVYSQYEDARSFEDGLAAVKIGGKWGYLAAAAAVK